MIALSAVPIDGCTKLEYRLRRKFLRVRALLAMKTRLVIHFYNPSCIYSGISTGYLSSQALTGRRA